MVRINKTHFGLSLKPDVTLTNFLEMNTFLFRKLKYNCKLPDNIIDSLKKLQMFGKFSSIFAFENFIRNI